MNIRDLLELARNKSLTDYLRSLGLKEVKKGSLIFFSSPFSSDSDPSLVVYDDKRYHDFSNGFSGDAIDIYMRLNSVGFLDAVKGLTSEERIGISKVEKDHYKERKKRKPFDISKYINKNEEEITRCVQYANSRSIKEEYLPGYYFFNKQKKTCIMFPHQDANGNIIGVKMRNIVNGEETRFTSRGSLMFYILYTNLRNHFNETCVYFVEGEANANSLYEFLKESMINAYVVSFGSVSSVKKKLPDCIEDVKKRFVIIDYDGSEEKYNERIKMYEGLNAEPIKLKLDKGEDINSIYSSKKMWLIKNLIIR